LLITKLYIQVAGDVKLVFYRNSKIAFSIYFHTSFIEKSFLVFNEASVDRQLGNLMKMSFLKVEIYFSDAIQTKTTSRRSQRNSQLEETLLHQSFPRNRSLSESSDSLELAALSYETIMSSVA